MHAYQELISFFGAHPLFPGAGECQVALGLLGLFWCFAALWVEVRLEQVYPGFDYAAPQDPEMKAYKSGKPSIWNECKTEDRRQKARKDRVLREDWFPENRIEVLCLPGLNV